MLPKKLDITRAKAIALAHSASASEKRIAAAEFDYFNRKTGRCDPSYETLQAWRIRTAGPPFVQVGRAIRYPRRDLIARIDANTIGPSPKRPS
jgi:hypothetical protein